LKIGGSSLLALGGRTSDPDARGMCLLKREYRVERTKTPFWDEEGSEGILGESGEPSRVSTQAHITPSEVLLLK